MPCTGPRPRAAIVLSWRADLTGVTLPGGADRAEYAAGSAKEWCRPETTGMLKAGLPDEVEHAAQTIS